MALPKIKHLVFELTVPSTKKKVSYKPFTVQEEKLLLMAKDSKDQTFISDTVKQIINNCILDENFDTETLTTFDIEYIIVKLRAKSIGEEVDMYYIVRDKEGKEVEKIEYTIHLDDIGIKWHENHKTKFMITDDLGVEMKYPSIGSVNIQENEQDFVKTIANCIKCVYDDDQVYDEFTQSEMEDFIKDLPRASLEKIYDFFQTMPTLEHEVKVKDSQGKEHKILLKGLTSFFTL